MPFLSLCNPQHTIVQKPFIYLKRTTRTTQLESLSSITVPLHRHCYFCSPLIRYLFRYTYYIWRKNQLDWTLIMVIRIIWKELPTPIEKVFSKLALLIFTTILNESRGGFNCILSRVSQSICHPETSRNVLREL